MPDVPEHLEPLSDLIEYFDHLAIGVRDVAAAANLLELLGGTFLTGADNQRRGFRWIQYRLPGGTKIEVLAPMTDDCFLWRFLRSRGRGCTISPSRCLRWPKPPGELRKPDWR